jgi:hypothetical protein
MRTISALAVATAASLYGLYGPTFVPELPASTATSIEQVQPASSFVHVSSVPATSPSDENSVQTSTSEVTVTATTLPAVSVGWNGKCVEWWSTAVRMGWPEELLPTLGEVMWNESRCQSDAHNTGSGDYGLTQINWGYHAQRTASFGYSRNDLYVPAVNLMIAYDIYLDALETSPNCGWWPWKASGNYCGGSR